MLSVKSSIDHGGGVRLNIEAKSDGVHLYFMENIGPKTWKAQFWITLVMFNFATFRLGLIELVNGRAGFPPFDEVRLDGISGAENGDFSLFVTKTAWGWFTFSIQDNQEGTRIFKCKIRETELINFIDETMTFLME